MSSKDICLGARSGELSDWLQLSGLPEKIRAKHPEARVRFLRRSFGSAVFRGNPSVAGGALFPSDVIGYEKARADLGLGTSEPVTPSLHVSERERRWANEFLADHLLPGNEGKPLVIIHPWHDLSHSAAPVEWWDELISRWKDRIRFWELGLIGAGAVVGCEYYYWIDGKPGGFRRVFALAEQARGFLGTPTGAMHIAAAFGTPSLITLQRGESGNVRLYPGMKAVQPLEADAAPAIETFLKSIAT